MFADVLAGEANLQLLSSGPDQGNAKKVEDKKVFIPSNQKLLSVETQRILGVDEDCISQVGIVAMLPAVMLNLDGLSDRLGKELSEALREHKLLEERLEGLDCPKQASDGAQEGDTEEAREDSGAKLERDIKRSMRAVLRQLRTHPAALHVFRAESEKVGGVSKSMQHLLGSLQDLYAILLEGLLTSPAQERKRRRHMQAVFVRHGRNMELIASLEKEVVEANKCRDAENSKKNSVIKKLKLSLHKTVKTSEDFILRTEQDAARQSHSDSTASEAKQADMQQKVSQLSVQLKTLTEENRVAETAQRKKKYKVETEVENWFMKYDADMGEKQADLEEIEEAFKEENQNLMELEETYAILEREYNQIQRELWRAEERKKEEQLELELKTKVAIIIQAMWRGYCVRKALSGKGKAKKPKKGKGKKGK